MTVLDNVLLKASTDHRNTRARRRGSCFFCGTMKNDLVLSDRLARQRTQEMLRVLRQKQNEILTRARQTWERRFAGREPSDACVRVRIQTPVRALLVA